MWVTSDYLLIIREVISNIPSIYSINLFISSTYKSVYRVTITRNISTKLLQMVLNLNVTLRLAHAI